MINLSIGIPSHERPLLLLRLIESIIKQKHLEHWKIEILIGDDSKASVYNIIQPIKTELADNITINYIHHLPSKGQNENVGSLIERAKGDFFCLMHDDDYFIEGSINFLLNIAMKNPNCLVFGKQLFLAKKYDYETSDKANADFKRSSSYQGIQSDSVSMAMLQQCPNDGFILKTEHAKRIGSRSANIIGTACDFDFALRATVVEKLNFYFVNEYTTVYNISNESVTNSTNNNAGERKLYILKEFQTDKTHPRTFKEILKTDLSMVISHYIIVKNYYAAKKHLYSFNNFVNYLWYKPATYIQISKILLKL